MREGKRESNEVTSAHWRLYAELSQLRRSEDETQRTGWGKPPVLISHFRNNTVACEPYFVEMLLCSAVEWSQQQKK